MVGWATEPQHVSVLLSLLYGATAPSAAPLNDFIPPKAERNREIYQRYLGGVSPAQLAREYGISEQRVYVIIRRERK